MLAGKNRSRIFPHCGSTVSSQRRAAKSGKPVAFINDIERAEKVLRLTVALFPCAGTCVKRERLAGFDLWLRAIHASKPSDASI